MYRVQSARAWGEGGRGLRTLYKSNWLLSVFTSLFPALKRISRVVLKALTRMCGDLVKDGRVRPPIPAVHKAPACLYQHFINVFVFFHNKKSCADVLT